MSKLTHILQLDASANQSASVSRNLGLKLTETLKKHYPASNLRQRDLNQDIPLIDAQWVNANFTREPDRSDDQAAQLELSDQLIEELKQADHIVLTTPMYNFGIPATLKAWIDQICRAGVTFQYTANGPVGLLQNRKVDIVVTTGGAPLNSPVDFVSGYLTQVFNFIGITDIDIFGADQMNQSGNDRYDQVVNKIHSRYPTLAQQEAS
ncbi:MAG: NAD(P)H-dependent oxidoreductase [Pseudomonadota bacterium]